jgi:hypothetical protein
MDGSKVTHWPKYISLAAVPPGKSQRSARGRAASKMGTRSAQTRKRTPAARAISAAWPRKPKPVMSVAPRAEVAWTARTASRFSRSIQGTAWASASGEACPAR